MADLLMNRARGARRTALTGRGPRALLALVVAAVSAVALAGPAAADPTGCPCSLWAPDAVPVVTDFDDAQPVELGVQFTVDVAAPVTGLRFYKGATNTGTHIGSLWTADGTLLARATFTAETASGWQQVSFATPVDATPGTRYVASYHAPVGHYSVDAGYFTAGPHDNGILHAPGADPSAPNGLFAYTPEPAFPTGTFNANNYWIDVVVGRPAPTLTGITLGGVPSPLAKGLTRPLTATATYSDGSTADATTLVTWTSSKPSVATVSSAGVLTATGTGSATITAALGGFTASAPVLVTPATIVSLTVTPGSATVRPLTSVQLAAVETFTDGTTVNVTDRAQWSTSNLLIATVGNLLVSGRAIAVLLPGSATITAKVDGRQASAVITVKW
jgi:hypothetical protein